jgi:BlaI family penicillinase repressor
MVEREQLPSLSEAQLEIMNVIWDEGEATVTDVWKILRKRRGVARNTVQTLITRLEEKGWLQHRNEGNRFLYSAVPERSAVLGRMVSQLVDSAFEGSAESLVMALLAGRGVSEKEAARIRAMIEKAEKKQS